MGVDSILTRLQHIYEQRLYLPDLQHTYTGGYRIRACHQQCQFICCYISLYNSVNFNVMNGRSGWSGRSGRSGIYSRVQCQLICCYISLYNSVNFNVMDGWSGWSGRNGIYSRVRYMRLQRLFYTAHTFKLCRK